MMLPNAAAPTPGADSVCPLRPWQIYMLRGPQWVPVGACISRPSAETQVSKLRQLMRGHEFAIAWVGSD